MHTPRLSVLLPCRNVAARLPEAIRGLRLQTFSDFEVIALNDGSTDPTGETLKRWASGDDRVRIVDLDGVGLQEALRVGSELCGSELLARADADDFAHPRRFAEQIRFLDLRPDIAVVGTHIRYFPWSAVGWGARRYQAWLNSLSEPEELERDLFVECPLAHPTLLARRADLEAAGGYHACGWPEDYDLLMRLHLEGRRFANVPRVLHFWRESGGRASRTDPRYSPEAFRRCKIHYLRLCHGQAERRTAFRIWGAGRVGKAFARTLLAAGMRVEAFFDIDPRKIDQEIYGVPVFDAREVATRGETYLLVAVGAAGARRLIRGELAEVGYEEPRDYRCVA